MGRYGERLVVHFWDALSAHAPPDAESLSVRLGHKHLHHGETQRRAIRNPTASPSA